MSQSMIIYPVLALAALTFGIAIWLAGLRVASVKSGEVSLRYYKLNQGGTAPDQLAKVNNNYGNLLELPILFYVVVVLLYVSEQVEMAQIILAWCFVASRYAHSYIHTTSNNVIRRMMMFSTGGIILILMWALFLVRMLWMPAW